MDPNLISKIEQGEYVDLEKLLPKDKKRRSEDNRMEWIYSEGSTYLGPVSDRANKINGFKRWEQAFRVYATIYCGANPHRSKEIWQYVAVISTASSSYVWGNVAEYDMTFRHLMAFNPSRSWAVMYNQMWNLCMCEPITPRSAFQSRYGGGGSGFGTNNQMNRSQSQNTKRLGNGKRQYCWNFNRGLTCKYGKKCRFIERCKYCDNASHGINTCPKLAKDTGNVGTNAVAVSAFPPIAVTQPK